MNTKENNILLWFAIIVALVIAISNLLSIREITYIMETMIETDKAIIYWMDFKNIMTII